MKIRSRIKAERSSAPAAGGGNGARLAPDRARLDAAAKAGQRDLYVSGCRDSRSESRMPAGGASCNFSFSLHSIPLSAASTSEVELLERAIKSGQSDLPHRQELERGFGLSLADLAVHRNLATQAVLDHFDAEAAVYQGHILLGDEPPSVQTLAHEVAHVLQQAPEIGAEAAGFTMAEPASENEAELLAQQVERRARLNGTVDNVQPLAVQTSVAQNALALRSTNAPGQPATPTSENAHPGQAAPAQEPTRAAEPQTPTSEPQSAERSQHGESALAGGGEQTPEAQAQLESPAQPESGVSPAQLAAHDQQLADSRAALEAAGTTADVMNAFAEAPPSLKAQAIGQIGSRMNEAVGQETQTLQENTPEVRAELSNEAEPQAGLVQVEAPPAPAVEIEPVRPAPAPIIELPPTQPAARFTANDGVVNRLITPGAAEQGNAEEVNAALHSVRTSDPGIATSPGPRPAVPLEGEADPQRLQNQTQEGRAQSNQALTGAQQAVLHGPGPERVQPVSLDESHRIEALTPPTVEPVQTPDGAQQFLSANLPPEVHAAFDESAGEQMRANVGEAQTQMQEATTQRDEQHQAEVDRAQQENNDLIRQADQDQRDQVTQARTQIQTERQSTLDQQQQQVRQVETQADTRRDHDRQSIDTRVADDRQRIDTRYQQAETDAQREVRDGEKQAEDRRATAQRESENQSWWDRAVNFIRDAFNALVSAIGAIFDAVRRAVNAVLDVAKNFAIGLINAATQFITRAIGLFGEFLKGLVQGLLGTIFPRLAAALTRFIDRAVTLAQRAVEGIADSLRRGVTALVEGLRAGINGLINLYQSAVNAALAVLQAAVTGDWGALARQLFEAIMRALGLDPAALYELIGRAQDSLQTIIDDPGAFLGHVLDAVSGGFQKFGQNFLQHLQTGIIGWLTGQLGGAGITLPERFDLMGVLSIVQQILGLTWDNIRHRLARLIGERGVQVLEFVAGYVQTLIQGGWSALWERIQEDLASLRDMVLDQIKTFLVERIIMAAITRLATMFNPVGAILNLVLTLYNLYTFLRDQLARIFAVVQSVVNAVSDIARGVIEPAATKVEGVLAGLLPLAIDLLARILGLGDVGERVRGILQSVQNAVWSAIDKLIERVVRMFRGGGSQDQQGSQAGSTHSQWEPIPFHAGGHDHNLFISMQGADATIMVASNPLSINGLYNNLHRRLESIDESKRVNAERLLNELRGQNSAAEIAAENASVSGAIRPEQKAQVEGKERQLVDILQELFDIFDLPAASAALEAAGAIPGLNEADPEAQKDIYNKLRQVTLPPSPKFEEHVKPYIQQFLDAPLDKGYFFGRAMRREIEKILEELPLATRPAQDVDQFIGRQIVSKIHRGTGSPFSEALEALKHRALNKNLDIKEKLKQAVNASLSSDIDENLKNAVTKKTIVGFLLAMASGETVEQVNMSVLRLLWATPTNKDFLKEKFRAAGISRELSGQHEFGNGEAPGGMHEWIPTNYMLEVVETASQLDSAERMATGPVWVRLFHEFRSPTRAIIFSPERYAQTVNGLGRGDTSGRTYKVLQGHIGAVYAKVRDGQHADDVTQQIKGQQSWHDGLRGLFKNVSNPSDLISSVENYAASTLWDGNIDSTLFQEYFNSRTEPRPLHALAGEKPKERVMQDMERLKSKYS
ncbi:MAG: DUF4157 domain-containing protein [Blastocatellia bacterium]|nr:DUF4157 domain-containing protein [Blastocatellia bacterium]